MEPKHPFLHNPYPLVGQCHPYQSFQYIPFAHPMYRGLQPIAMFDQKGFRMPIMVTNANNNFGSQLAQTLSKASEETSNQPSNATLERLKSRTASTVTQYYCHLCSVFTTSDVRALKCHLNVHSAPRRPFICQFCAKDYRFRCHWKNHIITHMAVRGKAVDNCKAFRAFDSEAMKACEELLRSEIQPSDLSLEPVPRDSLDQTTEDVSEKDRPYFCIFCNSTFPQSGSLKGLLNESLK